MTTWCPEGGVVQRRLRLDPVPESARLARQFVTEALDEAGQPVLSDAATLLVSELVTNAMLHARTDIEVCVITSPGGVRVGVTDHSPQPLQRRGYGTSATTGRGLALLDIMAERSGTDSEPDGGKTVWFELGSPDAGMPDHRAVHQPAPDSRLVEVLLLDTPLRLARAWQQHSDALLREYLLACWELPGSTEDPLAEHAAASDAFAALSVAFDAAAGDDDVTLILRLDPDQGAGFATLDRVLDEVVAMAERGELLAPPTQPEIRLLRRWLCSQIDGQLSGAAASPWVGLAAETVPALSRPVEWDASGVRSSSLAVIAADDSNRIIAASSAVLDLLGWSEDQLVGQRIVSVIPRRFREHHVASFTLHLLTGRTAVLDRPVRVPALHRDGHEVVVDLEVCREQAGGGRAVFVATFFPAD
ncbi:MAG: hypothetical protein QOE40_476 [Actinomycetota bacterium]|nr:hypothetical protein [Actinomycetota bacterium]